MAFPPEAYLIGAQKAGTTTLAFLLDQHPDITLSRPKEPRFFTRNWDKGLDWYRARFTGPEETIFIDATPGYGSLPVPCPPAPAPAAADPRGEVVRRIHDLRPDARFLYILRDPVGRTYSAYWHRVRAGEERRPFRAAILADSIYLRTSCYAAQIKAYLTLFPLEAFHIVTFEDLREDATAVARSCFRFLGVDPGFAPVPEAAKNVSYTYAPAVAPLAALGGDAAKRVLRAVKTLTPRRLRPFAQRLITRSIPPLDDADRRFLVEVFRAPNRELEDLLGRTFPRWQ
jgi:hypothetical protein